MVSVTRHYVLGLSEDIFWACGLLRIGTDGCYLDVPFRILGLSLERRTGEKVGLLPGALGLWRVIV